MYTYVYLIYVFIDTFWKSFTVTARPLYQTSSSYAYVYTY